MKRSNFMVSRAGGSRRQGVGMLLMVVLILVTVMTFIALARSFFSRSVTSQVLRSSLGIQAQTLAESAAEEALVELRTRVNDPSDPVFDEFRKEVYAGQESELSLGLDTPQLDALKDRFAGLSPFYLTERTVAVNFQRQFTSVPYERFGLAKVRASVGRDISLTNTVRRSVELGVEFKVHLLSTPRPFDQTAVYVHDGDAILRRAYQQIEDVLQGIEFRRAEHADIVDMMDSRKSSVPFNGEAMYTRYTDGVVIPESQYWRDKAPLLREPVALFALGRSPNGINLDHLQLEKRVREAADAVAESEELLEKTRADLEADFDNPERHNDYLNRLKITLGTYSEAVGRIETFRNLFQVWDGDRYDVLNNFSHKLSPEEWRRKATFILDRDPKGRSPQAVLDEQLKQPAGAFGVYYSSWASKRINLQNRRIKGRVVLIGEGTSLNLANVGGATEEDLLTVVSFGNLNLSGKIGASILALGSVSMEPGTEITGNLVFGSIRNVRELRGNVVHDPRYHSGRTKNGDVSGAKTEYYWVTVAPRPIYKAVDRGNR